MIVVHLSLPGLDAETIEGSFLGALDRHPADRRADLRASFPCLPPVVVTSIHCGVPPRLHCVMAEGDAVRPPARELALRFMEQEPEARLSRIRDQPPAPGRSLSEASESIEAAFAAICAQIESWRRQGGDSQALLCARVDGLSAVARTQGLGSPAWRVLLQRIDAGLDPLLALCHDEVTLLLDGGPPFYPTARRADLAAVDRAFPQLKWRIEGAIAQIREVPKERTELLLDALLRTDGVERILRGRALELWGADPNGGWIVLAEPGWSFEDHRTDCGHPQGGERRSQVLAWNAVDDEGWPEQIHDYRLGPALAHRLDVSFDGAYDSPVSF